MRYTHHRGLAAVTRWVRLKYAAMNLKKLANWSWKNSFFFYLRPCVHKFRDKTPVFCLRKQGFFDGLKERPSVWMVFLFWYGIPDIGLEQGGHAIGMAKKCPGDTFLACGRVLWLWGRSPEYCEHTAIIVHHEPRVKTSGFLFISPSRLTLTAPLDTLRPPERSLRGPLGVTWGSSPLPGAYL